MEKFFSENLIKTADLGTSRLRIWSLSHPFISERYVVIT